MTKPKPVNMPGGPDSLRPKNSATQIHAFGAFAKALQKPLTRAELCKKTGMATNTVDKWLKVLHQTYHLIYVHSYVNPRSSGQGVPSRVWAWGHMIEDAKRPEPMSHKEKYLRLKIRKRLQANSK